MEKDDQVTTIMDTEKLEIVSEEDLNVLTPYVVGELSLWGNIRPWWKLEKVIRVWRSGDGSPELIVESMFLHRIIPYPLDHSGFYIKRPDLRKSTMWTLTMALSENVFSQTDTVNCGVYALKSIECMLSRCINKIEAEKNIWKIKVDIAHTIYKYNTDEDTFVHDPLNTYN